MTYKHGTLWPVISEAIYKKYEIVEWINVLAEGVDLQPALLYQRLLPWKNKPFTSNQRIIIYHNDTEYYYEPGSSGFFLQNLYKIFAYLNIASEYVIIIHYSFDIKKESAALARRYNVPAMTTLFCPYQWCPPPKEVLPFDLNQHKIKKTFMCLNGSPRSHRIFTLALMKKMKILDFGATSLWNTSTSNSQSKLTSINIPNTLNLCCTQSTNRINDLLILNKSQQQVMTKYYESIKPHQDLLLQGKPNDNHSRYQSDFLQSTLWHVVTETVGDYPYSYISEKTWKVILTKRPFIILGGPGSLQHLKRLGFKTFDNWINESYENCKTFAHRCSSALNQLKSFCSLEPKQLQNIAENMQSILDYNFNHYIHVFGNTMVDEFIEKQL